MKTSVFIFMLLGIAGLALTGCNNKKSYKPDARIISAMNAKYPKAARIEWEQKHDYQVAEYYDNGVESEAWFDNNGRWLMTESDVKYTALPAAVRNGFEKSIYAGWKKDDIDKIERDGMAPVYVIEVEKEGQDMDLYFTAGGMMVKAVNDDARERWGNYLPVMPVIKDRVVQKYPDATIINTYKKGGRLYVDIVDNNKPKELIFDNNEWNETSWMVDRADVPSAVMNALQKSDYNNYRIKDITFNEGKDFSYYHFDLEQGGTDKELSIDPNGQIVNK